MVFLWVGELGMEIDPNIYMGKKHMEERAAARFAATGPLSVTNVMEGHNLLACVYQNEGEVDKRKKGDRAVGESKGNHTHHDRLQMTPTSRPPPVNLGNFKLTLVTFTGQVWAYHGDKCPLYSDLLEWCLELKGKSVMSNR